MTLLHDQEVFEFNDCAMAIQHEERKERSFDEFLQCLWNQAADNGVLRYPLNNVQTKIIPGRYHFVAQLNIERAEKRRKPQFISKVAQPFDASLFNFTKVPSQEILFELRPLHWERVAYADEDKLLKNLLIINISPLEYCNSLLVPNAYQCLPQVLTSDALQLAIETMLLSQDKSLRIGFNSLGAFASVNHLHIHLYYLNYYLYLETAPVKLLAGPCYEVTDFPSEGFVFQLLDMAVAPIVESVMKLVSFLIQKEIAHNLFLTRGTSFRTTKSCERQSTMPYDALRIYVWAREFSFGAKDDFAFNPALCELAGHLPIKSKHFYESVSEKDVEQVLKDVCHKVFMAVHDGVQELFA